jgi:hypothetical protein
METRLGFQTPLTPSEALARIWKLASLYSGFDKALIALIDHRVDENLTESQCVVGDQYLGIETLKSSLIA